METLLRKIPPAEMGKTMEGIFQKSSLDQKEKDKLEKDFPVPFAICSFGDSSSGGDKKDIKKEKTFIMCNHNKVANGEYRSPWNNKVYKAGGVKTSTKSPQTDDMLLDLEKKFNNVWSAYAKLYYGSQAVSSCFLGETEDKKFQAVFCIHKASDDGAWHSYHIVHMDDPTEKTCQYHVTSTVWVQVNPDCSEYNSSSHPTKVDASVYLTKSVSKVMKIERFFLEEYHLQNIGSIVEANEIDMRSNLEQVYFPKTKDIMDSIQKEPEKPRQVNPLMGMIMDSNVLKKKKLGQKAGP
ncbi:hypothetical protein ACA910_005767 [Epithemia clementina (nom. ined.)]